MIPIFVIYEEWDDNHHISLFMTEGGAKDKMAAMIEERYEGAEHNHTAGDVETLRSSDLLPYIWTDPNENYEITLSKHDLNV